MQAYHDRHIPTENNRRPRGGARILGWLAVLLFALTAQAQNSAYEAYIRQYKDRAIDQMKRHGIPASITLAQALLESGAGKSMLAQKANNHFGIKVGMGWTGPYILCSDDRPDDRFRVYKSPAESYEDHSLFLKNGRRYAALFTLSRTDYKGWAHGLKRAGYATNPRYAQSLIEIIERYGLAQYDREEKPHRHRGRGSAEEVVNPAAAYDIRYNNKNYYVVAKAGDTFASIGRAMGMSERKLRRYNEVDKYYTLQAGDIVYLEKKQKRADKSYKRKYHTVKAGESMYTIAQTYGMRLETLYKTNHLPPEHRAAVGERLRIR